MQPFVEQLVYEFYTRPRGWVVPVTVVVVLLIILVLLAPAGMLGPTVYS